VKESGMANLTLVYGMRLLPADEVASVGEAPVALKNGNEALPGDLALGRSLLAKRR